MIMRKSRQAVADMRARRRAAGLCHACGLRRATGRCNVCREKSAKYHAERRVMEKRSLVCTQCSTRKAAPEKTQCRRCLDRKQKFKQKLKDDALAAYGGPACVACSETRIECLQLDHVNNDGAAHRKVLGSAAGNMYAWLRKNKYPTGFQVLCASCNFIKRDLGFVPDVHRHRKTGRHRVTQ